MLKTVIFAAVYQLKRLGLVAILKYTSFHSMLSYE